MNVKRSRAVAKVMSSRKRFLLILSLILMIMLIYNGVKVINVKKLEYDKKAAYMEDLNEDIREEEEKLKQLENSRNKTITDEDYESLAREELGLIKKDEIVIKPR